MRQVGFEPTNHWEMIYSHSALATCILTHKKEQSADVWIRTTSSQSTTGVFVRPSFQPRFNQHNKHILNYKRTSTDVWIRTTLVIRLRLLSLLSFQTRINQYKIVGVWIRTTFINRQQGLVYAKSSNFSSTYIT